MLLKGADLTMVSINRWTALNGKRLVMPSESSMPDLNPVVLAPGSLVIVPPLTLGYFVFPEADIKLCSQLMCS